jgi:osmoprotectant transport system ATP-binding protein
LVASGAGFRKGRARALQPACLTLTNLWLLRYSPAVAPHTVEIAFEGVSLARGGRPVLKAVDLAIERGETLALVGRSGAGKSTILKLVNRLLAPDAGLIRVSDRVTTDWDPFDLRRHVGYVLQEIALFPHMSVAENVAVVPRLLGWDDARVMARVRELLDLTGLGGLDFASRRPHELSGGQRQRVGVARALAADPPILLMDEPFGALDPITRSEMHEEFRRIQAQVRKTILIVTHDMGEAFAMATRIGVLADGALAALDGPAAIARSTDPRVRGLLAPLVEATAALTGGTR